jgi:hypothetical protein
VQVIVVEGVMGSIISYTLIGFRFTEKKSVKPGSQTDSSSASESTHHLSPTLLSASPLSSSSASATDLEVELSATLVGSESDGVQSLLGSSMDVDVMAGQNEFWDSLGSLFDGDSDGDDYFVEDNGNA